MMTGLLKPARMEHHIFYTNMEVYEVFNIQILIAKLKMVKPTGARKILITKYIKRKTQPINITLSAYQERER